MKTTTLAIALTLLTVSGNQAFAELCTIDQVPAATLLFPYVSADVSDEACATGSGVNTVLAIANASAAPTLAHLEFWTDLSVPILDFDIYLTGYDVQTFSIQQLFCDGTLPHMGFTTSPVGAFSDPNIDFPGCNDPLYEQPPPAISASFRSHLRAWCTGKPSPLTGDCAGADRGDTICKGYITVDATRICSIQFADDPLYWDSATRVPTEDNVLWGDWFLVDQEDYSSQGFSAVHIEGDPTEEVFRPGDHTFYGRYVSGNASDRREPLGTTFGARYALGGAFDGTTFFVWRSGGPSQSSRACPANLHLDLSNNTGDGPIIVFDEQENSITVSGPSGVPDEVVNLPWETQSVEIGTQIPTGDFNFGWIYLNLQNGTALPLYGDDNAQGWVSARLSAAGRYSVGLHGVQFDNACSNASFAVTPAGATQQNPGL